MKEKIANILKTVLVLFLAVLVIIMMLEIRKIQGTARVINYAGLVRGATQREVKLEITGTSDDEMIADLDDILNGLKYGNGGYSLVSLPDRTYQNKLDEQISYWNKLKEEILSVRENGYEATDVIAISETYFNMADETVTSAEIYSERVAGTIRVVEILSILDIIMLVLIIIQQTIADIRIKNKNKVLEKKAYVDLQTGLPNKSKCEEMLRSCEYITEPMGFVMFDLNNLKLANDTYGHAVGDQLITNFAKLLRNSIPSKYFVGRYGGDEFIALLTDVTKDEVEEIIASVQNEVKRYNEFSKQIRIDFAYGYALSTSYQEANLKVLLNQADKNMYDCKTRMKQARKG